MIVSGGQVANFNYGAFDGATGLFVGGIIYNISTGLAILVGNPVPMTDLGDGTYVGTFTPSVGAEYLVICACFTDNTYVTLNSDRPAAAYNYESVLVNNTGINFNYAASDQSSSLTILATRVSTTDQTISTVFMTYVTAGVYFGQLLGKVGNNYYVTKVPTNSNYPPAIESFQCFLISSGMTQAQTLIATLVGQQLEPGETYQFTQGDTALLSLVATDGLGNPIDISMATFTSLVKGPNDTSNVMLPNINHTVLDGPNGVFTLAFASTDTAACGTGRNKDILTQIVIGASTVWYRGINILAVHFPAPLQ